MRAVIFPGQGAQKLGMAKDYYEQFKASRVVFDRASDAAGLDLAKLVFEEEDKINLTEYTQVALVTAELAIAEAMKQEGIITEVFCDVTCGLSLGEYSSLVLAGAMTVEQAAAIVRQRGIFMQEAVPPGKGAMAAVLGMPVAEIETVLEGLSDVWIANYNSDAQTVITGLKGAVDIAAVKLKEAGAKRVVPLAVSGPFHSPLMDMAAMRLEPVIQDITLGRLNMPYVANVTGDYVSDEYRIKDLLVKQVYSPVRFLQSVKRMTEKGVDCFVEVGPGNTLTKLINKISPESATINIATVEDLIKFG